jgi:Cdc6-like AAA superfamily ATPase
MEGSVGTLSLDPSETHDLQLHRFFREEPFSYLFCTNPNWKKIEEYGYHEEPDVLAPLFIRSKKDDGTIPLYLYSTHPEIHVFTPQSIPDPDYNSNPNTDEPATEDLLGRQSLIDDLDEIIDHVFKDNKKTNFTVLINGDWGSGKSSIWNMLSQRLNPAKWKKVEYNAWEHHHLKNPWWILINMISQAASRENWNGSFNSHTWWSLKMKYRLDRILFSFFIVMLLLILSTILFEDTEVENISKIVGISSTILGFFTGLFTKFFVSNIGNEELKDRFPEHPYGRIRSRFKSLMEENNLVIFIDDLDRCEPEPTVKLLESIQTLFKGERILYVIAADQQWLIRCFNEYYKVFRDISTSGISLGEKFIQKSFQLRVNIPRIEKNRFKEYYLKQIIEPKKSEISVKTKGNSAADGTKDLGAEGQSPSANNQASTAKEILVQKKKYLEEFIEAGLPKNPRLLKLFLNQYIVMRSILKIEGFNFDDDTEGREKAVRFLIFSMKYPSLANQLKNNNSSQIIVEKLTDEERHDIETLLKDIDEKQIKGDFYSI